jgi:hypothetical protein
MKAAIVGGSRWVTETRSSLQYCHHGIDGANQVINLQAGSSVE